MAYVSNNVSLVESGVYRYQTQDNIALLTASGYFSDLVSTHSGGVGDYILVTDGTYDVSSTANRFILEVVSVSGNAATAEVVGGRKNPTKTLTAATTLSGGDSGFNLYLDADTEFAVTLPAASLAGGYEYDVIIADAPSGADYTVVTAGGENTLYGFVTSPNLNSTVAGGTASGADTINFEDGVSVEGDYVNLTCDGAKWYVKGGESAIGGITFGTT